MASEEVIKLPSSLNSHFKFKVKSDGSVDTSVALCILCKKEFKYHRSNSTLQYHLKSKHIFAEFQERVKSSM